MDRQLQEEYRRQLYNQQQQLSGLLGHDPYYSWPGYPPDQHEAYSLLYARQQAEHAAAAGYSAYSSSPYGVRADAYPSNGYGWIAPQQQQAPPLPPKEPELAPTPKTSASSSTPKSTNSAGAASQGSPASKPPKSTKKKSKKPPKPSPPKARIVGNQVTDADGNPQWYTGSVPLGIEDDKYWLSELQVYLRANFAEAFGATEDDIAAPMHGRNKPIALGQVGIRCIHCKDDNPAERGQQATSYPSMIGGIYNSVQQMLRLHLDCCLSMPPDVRAKIDQLKESCSSRGGRKQYWIDSARRLGLVDTPHGIHFERDPLGPMPPLSGPSVQKSKKREKKEPPKAIPAAPDPNVPLVDDRPLVFPEDEALISDYLYLTLEQMAPCTLMESDRVGCYKTRKLGFAGLACKHVRCMRQRRFHPDVFLSHTPIPQCVGQAGCGRYFPASEASLSQTTTSQTIMNHVRNCRRCPIEIRENLEIMKRNRMGDRKRPNNKPKHGGRKVFFHRLWCRIQNVPFEEGLGMTKEPKKKALKKTGPKRKYRKRKQYDDSDDSMEDTSEGSDDEESVDVDESPRPKPSSILKDPHKRPVHHACVRMSKGDDIHWLSEMEIYARNDLIELFTLEDTEDLGGYAHRAEPDIGQVGIRCVFCKNDETRPSHCMDFPDSLSSLQTKVADMIRLHLPRCPSMPDDVRENFRALRGFDAKIANDDSQQYWVDAARDLGLSNIPAPRAKDGNAWGITFRRDPLQPSPADEFDLDNEENSPDQSDGDYWNSNMLVRPVDRGLCTDQVLFLLRQIRPCRFQKSDRRAGPGSRGRDRAMGFPGLACVFCANKNALGRYYPVTAKNLTDSTVNSLQSHIFSCSRCPEPVKASLAYLGHRGIMQKAELSGSWKRAYFKRIWDRLHVERKWTPIEDEAGSDGDQGESDEGQEEEMHESLDAAAGVNDDDEEDSESDKEELGDHMNALIHAAAIWLTDMDANNGTTPRAATKRTLPSKRRRVQL